MYNMKRFLLLIAIITPQFIYSQLQIEKGNFLFNETGHNYTVYRFDGNTVDNLYWKTMSFLDEINGISPHKGIKKEKISVDGNISGLTVKVFGRKFDFELKYTLDISIRNEEITIESPVINKLEGENGIRGHMKPGTNGAFDLYVYKKNGETRYVEFENQILEYFNNMINDLVHYIKTENTIFEDIFLGREDYPLYNKALLKTKKMYSKSALEDRFYKTLDDAVNNRGVAMPTSYNTTDSKAIDNKIFQVDTIFVDKKNPFKPIFQIRDTLSNEILFYKYPFISMDFPFLSCDRKKAYSEEDVLPFIIRKVDEFTDDIKIYSPDSKFVVNKVIKTNGETILYVMLKTTATSLSINEKGIYVIFEDGTRITGDSTINVEVKEGKGWDYWAPIDISSENNLKLFSSKRIKKFRLYVYDEEFAELTADKFMNYIKAIAKMD